jgi:hypothetical protein
MRVLDVVKAGHLTVAVVKGAPGDYRAERPEDVTDHLIMRVGRATYYDLDGDRAKTILKRINDPKDHLGRLLGEEEEPSLDLPLLVGKVFGDPEQVTRIDLFYCWTVLKEEEVDLSTIKGLELLGKRKQFTLRYMTLPDEVFIDFVPGVGVTGYRFKHHGTVDEADLKLVEANRGIK